MKAKPVLMTININMMSAFTGLSQANMTSHPLVSLWKEPKVSTHGFEGAEKP